MATELRFIQAVDVVMSEVQQGVCRMEQAAGGRQESSEGFSDSSFSQVMTWQNSFYLYLELAIRSAID